jgi:hypothetical protein
MRSDARRNRSAAQILRADSQRFTSGKVFRNGCGTNAAKRFPPLTFARAIVKKHG